MTFDRLEQAFRRFAAFIAILGGLGLIAATLVTCVSIILKMVRRLLDGLFAASYAGDVPWANIRSILGEEELVTYGVGFALFAALPWVMIEKGHIKIDLFERFFGEWFNRFLDLLGDLSFAIIAYLIFTRQWFLIFKKARRSQEPMLSEVTQGNWAVIGDRLRDTQESQILGLPLWPTYIVAEICVFFFLVVAVFCVVRSARALILPKVA